MDLSGLFWMEIFWRLGKTMNTKSRKKIIFKNNKKTERRIVTNRKVLSQGAHAHIHAVQTCESTELSEVMWCDMMSGENLFKSFETDFVQSFFKF